MMRAMPSHRSRCAVLLALAALPAAPGAQAGSSSVGAVLTFERMPDDFALPKSTDVEVNAAHSFDNHVILGGSVKYYDDAGSSSATTNAQATIGYGYALDDVFSLTATAGIGGHFQTSGEGNDFAYYLFQIAADVALTESVTWNAVSVRYRNAFDTANDYNTPNIATGVTFRLNDHHSVSVAIERDWKDGQVSYDAIDIGYKYHF